MYSAGYSGRLSKQYRCSVRRPTVNISSENFTCWWQSSASISGPSQSFPPKAGLRNETWHIPFETASSCTAQSQDRLHWPWLTLAPQFSPWVIAFPCAMSDSPTTCPWAGGERWPAGPGAVHHYRGAELIQGDTAALQTPLQESITPHEEICWGLFLGNNTTLGKWLHQNDSEAPD